MALIWCQILDTVHSNTFVLFFTRLLLTEQYRITYAIKLQHTKWLARTLRSELRNSTTFNQHLINNLCKFYEMGTGVRMSFRVSHKPIKQIFVANQIKVYIVFQIANN